MSHFTRQGSHIPAATNSNANRNEARIAQIESMLQSFKERKLLLAELQKQVVSFQSKGLDPSLINQKVEELKSNLRAEQPELKKVLVEITQLRAQSKTENADAMREESVLNC